MDIEFIQKTVPVLMQGLSKTLLLSGLAILFGFNLGLGLALARLSECRIAAKFAKGYSTFSVGHLYWCKSSSFITALDSLILYAILRSYGGFSVMERAVQF